MAACNVMSDESGGQSADSAAETWRGTAGGRRSHCLLDLFTQPCGRRGRSLCRPHTDDGWVQFFFVLLFILFFITLHLCLILYSDGGRWS